jgi:hypothetical protein
MHGGRIDLAAVFRRGRAGDEHVGRCVLPQNGGNVREQGAAGAGDGGKIFVVQKVEDFVEQLGQQVLQRTPRRRRLLRLLLSGSRRQYCHLRTCWASLYSPALLRLREWIKVGASKLRLGWHTITLVMPSSCYGFCGQ